MSVTAAFRDGVRRVNAAPILIVGMCTLTLLVALPLSLVLRGLIESQLGSSLAADAAGSGVNYDWWQEFSAQASGLGTTFVPSIVGFGAVLDNLSGLLDNVPLASTIGGVTAAWLLLWSFLSGGVMDRLARGRPTRAHGFFAACGTHVWRFIRLGVMAWFIYYLLFAVVHDWLFGRVYESAVANLAVERTAFAIRLACYLLFGALLLFFNIIFDYARVRIVVEDRRSAIGALAAGARFVRRHFGQAVALYLLNGAAFLTVALLYAVISPGAPRSGIAMWGVLVLGQMYIVARHYLKLLFYASETAFFQSALAHAAYTAAPVVLWPDSPAAESIVNAAPTVVR
ncbi:MAG: hypothetical protein LC753_04825 [Acidobacteria bacterium]|nr:hypothetical protein [Acidobacteriota bacterium]MCA1649623.1 hypothetical protein [Acidobacteriota bacterium]